MMVINGRYDEDLDLIIQKLNQNIKFLKERFDKVKRNDELIKKKYKEFLNHLCIAMKKRCGIKSNVQGLILRKQRIYCLRNI